MSEHKEAPRTGGVNSVNLGKLRKRWLVYSILGLLLVGAGVSITGEAIIVKGAGAATADWFLLGTAGLIVLNSGLSFFGQGVIEKVRLDRHRYGE